MKKQSWAKTISMQRKNYFVNMLPGWTGKRILDLGANDGYFSRVLAETNNIVIAADSDDLCIQTLYEEKNKKILPLHPGHC